MAADETYFTKTYSKLKEYLLKKGYRKDCIIKDSICEMLCRTVGVYSENKDNLIEAYYIIEEDNLGRIKKIVDEEQEKSEGLFPKNMNYYAVTDGNKGFQITEASVRTGTVLTFYKQAVLSLEAADGEQLFYRGALECHEPFPETGHLPAAAGPDGVGGGKRGNSL